MADPTPLDPIELSGAYPSAGATVVYTAGDASNGNTFRLTGREVILVKNTSVDTGFYVRIASKPDSQGRDLANSYLSETIAFGDEKAYGPLALKGWMQDDGTLKLTPEDAAIEFAVLVLPR